MAPGTDSLIFLFLLLGIVLSAAVAWRWRDRRADRSAWRQLAARQAVVPHLFDVAMLDDLPEAAGRFMRFAIAPGTPLFTVAQIRMHGQFSLGNKAAPNYVPMQATQILAAPFGFVWEVRAGARVPISGSDALVDGVGWSRFWLGGLLPVARAGGDADHARAAFGRCIAEAVFWTPAALLQHDGVQWEAVDESTVRVVVTHGSLEQAVDLTIDADGRAEKVVFQRWSNANAAKTYRLQPFGGYLSEYRQFGGFQLPTRIEAGNFFGTEEYFPFFRATVTSVQFHGATFAG